MLEPGVYSKVGYLNYKNPDIAWENDIAVPVNTGRPVEFVGFKNVPMGDWDWPDAIHADASVSVKNAGDAFQNLEDFTGRNGGRWDVFLTPGGVRAFDLSNQMSPRQFEQAGRFEELNIDPLYRRFSLDKEMSLPRHRRDNPDEYNQLYPTNNFNVRIDSKPGREGNDFVAYRLGTVGKDLPNPQNVRLVREYHDKPIVKAMINQNLNPRSLPDSAIDLIDKQLPTIPRQYQFNIERQLDQISKLNPYYQA